MYTPLLLKTVRFTLLKPTLKDILIPFYEGEEVDSGQDIKLQITIYLSNLYLLISWLI